MKKNILKYITAGCLLATLSVAHSCQDFLTVRPKYSYPDYLMFKSEGGFQDAMVGVYMVARRGPYNLSGGLTGGIDVGLGRGFIEMLSCFWPVYDVYGAGGSASYALYSHNYESEYARDAGDMFYMDQHTPVTNINFILKWIDDEEQNFLSEKVYNIVKAEALAMRALCMFDVIRTYGPPPTPDAASLFGNRYAAYPRTIQTEPYARETYTDFMKYLLDDISTAERLMEGHDPIADAGVAVDNAGFGWLAARRSKMNYYAIKLLKARIYLWMGGEENKDIALEAAKTVIESRKFSFDTWNWAAYMESGKNSNATSYMMGRSEHVFCLLSDGNYEINPLDSKRKNNYAFACYVPIWGYDIDGKVELLGESHAPHRDHLKNVFTDAVYVVDSLHHMKSNDLRLQLQMVQGKLPLTGAPARGMGDDDACPYEGHATYKRFTYNVKNAPVPVLRLAEAYLIAAECEKSYSKAEEYINTLRKARWKTNSDGYQVTISNEQERMDWVIGEYVREFYQEGQIFFHYKRLNLKTIPYASEKTSDAFYGGDVLMTTESYILPLPVKEYSAPAVNTKNETK